MISVLLAIKIGLDPTLVEIAGAEITWHGLFTAVGVMAGGPLAAWFGRRAAFDEDTIYNVALALVIGGIIGARGLFVLENLDTFKDDPGDIFRVNTGGISIYGALIRGAAGAWLPAASYELRADLLIFAVLFLVYRRSQRAGVTFFSWVFLYGLLRVFVSFLRR